MFLATSNEQLRGIGLGPALERWLRLGVGYQRPRDVLKDPALGLDDKRAVIASWASDASAVKEEPAKRWLLGTPAPVPLTEVREALQALET